MLYFRDTNDFKYFEDSVALYTGNLVAESLALAASSGSSRNERRSLLLELKTGSKICCSLLTAFGFNFDDGIRIAVMLF